MKRVTLTLVSVVIILALAGGGYYLSQTRSVASIKVGVLHSMSGTMASSEQPVVDATLLAIEEINQAGGVLGRPIEPIVVDGQSDWPTFAQSAEALIVQDKVNVVFGCWTSASRRTVKPIFEKYNHLLFYPVQYEGLEASPNIIYTGASPNQQIIPAVKWAFDNVGTKFFLVGSDYVFPRAANEIMKAQIAALRGEVVGEAYILLGSTEVEAIVQQIIQVQPDMILNTINGDSNVAFFKALRAAGVTPDQVPTMSFSIAESELQTMGTTSLAGDYAAWNYFQSVVSQENADFVEKFKNKYGADRVVNDPMEAAYFGVYLWAQAVEQAGTAEVDPVRTALKNQSFNAPEGIVYIDADTQHTWKIVRIGQIRTDGQFDIVWGSENPIRPVPYPVYFSQAEWEQFLNDLYTKWDGNWANPGN